MSKSNKSKEEAEKEAFKELEITTKRFHESKDELLKLKGSSLAKFFEKGTSDSQIFIFITIAKLETQAIRQGEKIGKLEEKITQQENERKQDKEKWETSDKEKDKIIEELKKTQDDQNRAMEKANTEKAAELEDRAHTQSKLKENIVQVEEMKKSYAEISKKNINQEWIEKREIDREFSRITNSLIIRVSDEVPEEERTEKAILAKFNAEIGKAKIPQSRGNPKAIGSKKDINDAAKCKKLPAPRNEDSKMKTVFRYTNTLSSSKRALFQRMKDSKETFAGYSVKNEIPINLMNANNFLEKMAFQIRDKERGIKTRVITDRKTKSLILEICKKDESFKDKGVQICSSNDTEAMSETTRAEIINKASSI